MHLLNPTYQSTTFRVNHATRSRKRVAEQHVIPTMLVPGTSGRKQDMTQSALYTFYEEQVLPTLFEQLDRVFPEFRWNRTTAGWTAQRIHENGSTHLSQSIVCQHNWGFVDQTGTTTSWLAYASAGLADRGFVGALRHLASLAGIYESALPTAFSLYDVEQAESNERRRYLVESYLGYCHAALHSESGRQARLALRRDYQMDDRQVLSLPVGYLTTPDEVAQRLTSVGFSREEIIASHVVCDPRLAGRLIVPWRDRWGRVATIVALDAGETRIGEREVLYLRGGRKPQAFGLDVALRLGSGGRDHLLLVDRIVDVLYLQSLGVANVAAVTTPHSPVKTEQWQHLADHGVRTVTLVLGGQDRWGQRTVTSLKQSYAAGRAPQLFTLTNRELMGTSGAADFVRREGLERFRRVLRHRIHGFQFVALDIAQRHRSSTGWSEQTTRQILVESADFDRAQRQTANANDLEKYFWPTIVDQKVGHAVPNSVSRFHGQDPRDLGQFWGRSFSISASAYQDASTLLSDLELSLRKGDWITFHQLLAAAHKDLGNVRLTGSDEGNPNGAWNPKLGINEWRLFTSLQQAYRARDWQQFQSLIRLVAEGQDRTWDRWGNSMPLPNDTSSHTLSAWETESRFGGGGSESPGESGVSSDVKAIRDLAYAVSHERNRPDGWAGGNHSTRYEPASSQATAARQAETEWENSDLVVH